AASVINCRYVKGGGGGWVIADSVDATVVPDHLTLKHLSGPAVETVECSWFTATVTGGPRSVENGRQQSRAADVASSSGRSDENTNRRADASSEGDPR